MQKYGKTFTFVHLTRMNCRDRGNEDQTMEWIEKLDANVIVCDAKGIIIYMNERAIRNYEADGGAALIGKNLMDCHNDRSREKILRIMATGEKNVYTISKKGKKKLIYQSPWFRDGEFCGIVEFSLEIPEEMEHFNRD